jgi:branched-chain amino acid transport system substrate-binding protein
MKPPTNQTGRMRVQPKRLRYWIGMAAAVLAVQQAWAQSQPAETRPITIGVLTDMSGSSADMAGPGSVEAVKLAVADAGGTVLGRKLAVLAGDHQLRPDIATGLARQWFDTDGVQLIVDVPVSSAGLAVEVVANEKHKLFITTATLTSDFTNKFCSTYAMQWNYDTVALARAAATAAVQRGLNRWFFLTADYAFGQALQRDATKVLLAQGGTVVGSALHPFNSPDLTSFVLQAVGSDANTIALANGPPDNVTAIKQANEFGVAGSGKTIVSMFTVLTDIKALGLKLAAGLIFPDSFYWDRDDASRAWSARFKAVTGREPTSVQAADYSAASHWLKAVAAAGTLDPLKVAATMRSMPVQDAFTNHGTLRPDGLMVHDLFLMRVKLPSESAGEWDLLHTLSTIPGDTVFPSMDEEQDCALARQ